jgi:hypothetical protein
MERFGNWIENKVTPFDELKDMPGSGQGLDIFKKLMNKEHNVILFTLLSMGGVDILGGWKFQSLLCQLAGKQSNDEEMIDTSSKPDVKPDFELQQEGIEKLQKLFDGGLNLKVPFYWRSISMM